MTASPDYEEVKRENRVVGYVLTWKNLKAGEVGLWWEAVGMRRSAYLYGNLNAKCIIEGSNDRENAGGLNTDFASEATLKENSRFVNINEISRYIRPNVIGGDKNTDVTVSIMVIL